MGLTPFGRAKVEALELNRERAIRIRAADLTVGRHPVLPQFILPAKSRDKIPVKRVGSTILSFPAIGLKKHLIISSQYRPLDNNLCGHGSGNFVRGRA